MTTEEGLPWARVYFGLGTNLGDRESNLRAALQHLVAVVDIDAVSSVYETEPMGYQAQPEFWNLVVQAHTTLEPGELLAIAKRIERDLGRKPAFRNAPRVIDIDLLLYDDLHVVTPTLEIPHPRMLERAFVLRPLAELEPELRHPVTGERMAERLSAPRAGLGRAEPLFPGKSLLERHVRLPERGASPVERKERSLEGEDGPPRPRVNPRDDPRGT